jgi:hypothetical protein
MEPESGRVDFFLCTTPAGNPEESAGSGPYRPRFGAASRMNRPGIGDGIAGQSLRHWH